MASRPRRFLLIMLGIFLMGIGGYFAFEQFSPSEKTSRGSAEKKNGAVPVSQEVRAPLPEMVLGEKAAPVTIVEYASATCPHCAKFHRDVFPGLKKEFIDTGKVRFIFREFPLDSVATGAFMIARCAPQDRYFSMLDVLFSQQAEWLSGDPRAGLLKVAQIAVGMSQQTFDACLKDVALAQKVLDVRERATAQDHVTSTPTFFVNGKRFDGETSLDDFRKVIGDVASSPKK